MSYAAMSLAYASPSADLGAGRCLSLSRAAPMAMAAPMRSMSISRPASSSKAGDIFDAKAQGALKADCLAQILAQKKEKWEGEEYKPSEDPNFQEATVGEVLAGMAAWTLRSDKATVTFDAYVVGSYAEGPYYCEFPMEKLRGMAKAGAPLPE